MELVAWMLSLNLNQDIDMCKFVEVEASALSLAKRKPVFGIGINDALYSVSTVVEGKQLRCPYYVKWKSMLTRCYDSNYLAKRPLNIGCSVCTEWLSFSVFKQWMAQQEWEGMHLDKDLLVYENKVYSPGTCIFIPSRVNSLFAGRREQKGIYSPGVFKSAGCSKFVAKCGDGLGNNKF